MLLLHDLGEDDPLRVAPQLGGGKVAAEGGDLNLNERVVLIYGVFKLLLPLFELGVDALDQVRT